MRMSDSDICPHCGENVHYAGSPAHLPAGYVVSGKHPYVLGAALGQGGFGITYIALDMVNGQRVAIKEYFPTHCSGRTGGNTVTAYSHQEDVFQKGKDRFLDEAKTLKSLSDLKNIVNVLDYFEANNTAYLVMEFLDGSSLKEYAAGHGRFPAQKFLAGIRPLMEDIHRMHERGVIHRDIAPDNIILLPDGQMKLIDFGAARSYVGDKSMTVVVKKGFAPVEQYMSKGSTSSTDVYALAATVYYCITGKVPPDSAERQYDDAPLASPSSLGAEITPKQEKALLKAMALMQKERTQSVQDFLNQLSANDAVKPKTPKIKAEKPKTESTNADPGKRKKLPVILASVAAVLVLLAAAFLLIPAKEFSPSLKATEPASQQTTPAPTYEPQDEPTYPPDAWQANLLHSNFTQAFDSVHTPVYGSEIPRHSIRSITFLQTIRNAPNTSWDVSEAQDGSVLAWVLENGEYYDLYLAANGGINAGTSVRARFANFTRLAEVHNLHFFHLENVTDMSSMFANCGSLTACDLSQSDISNVTTLNDLFQGCTSLSSINLDGLDTSNVENISGMFKGCRSLNQISLSGLDLSNVRQMDNMFTSCWDLTEVSFFGLDLSRAERLNYMFSDCKNLSTCVFSQTKLPTEARCVNMFKGCSSLSKVLYGSSKSCTPEEFVQKLESQ